MDSSVMLHSRRFQMHSKYFIEMLDKALGMVEAKGVEENMKILGQLHYNYGVKEEFFPVMGDALFHALEVTVPAGSWNEDVKAAWGNVYDGLSSAMISSMKKAGKKQARRNQSRCSQTTARELSGIEPQSFVHI